MNLWKRIRGLFKRDEEPKPTRVLIRETQVYYCPPEARAFARGLLEITPEQSAATLQRWRQRLITHPR